MKRLKRQKRQRSAMTSAGQSIVITLKGVGGTISSVLSVTGQVPALERVTASILGSISKTGDRIKAQQELYLHDLKVDEAYKKARKDQKELYKEAVEGYKEAEKLEEEITEAYDKMRNAQMEAAKAEKDSERANKEAEAARYKAEAEEKTEKAKEVRQKALQFEVRGAAVSADDYMPGAEEEPKAEEPKAEPKAKKAREKTPEETVDEAMKEEPVNA